MACHSDAVNFHLINSRRAAEVNRQGLAGRRHTHQPFSCSSGRFLWSFSTNAALLITLPSEFNEQTGSGDRERCIPWTRGIRDSVSVRKMTNVGSWMKTNGPGKMLFIIDHPWVVVLSKSGPSLFSKTRRDTRVCLNCLESDLFLPIKNVQNNPDDRGNAKATLFIHSNCSRPLQREGQPG